MRICLFNGFPFHYDFFGFVLEYLFARGKDDVVVFTGTKNSMGWMDVYEKAFGRPLHIRPISEFKDTEWDYVFLLTDDDKEYKQSWTHAKVIMFEHSAIRRTPHPAVYKHMQIRHFTIRAPPSPEHTWTLPIWDYKCGPKRQRKPRTQIAIIGNNLPTRPYEFIDLLPNFYDLDIVYVNRKESWIKYDYEPWEEFSNFHIKLDVDASELIQIIHDADWLILPPFNQHHQIVTIASMVMLGYSIGTPILMTKAYAESYGYGGIGVLDYETDVVQPSSEFMAAFEKQRKELFKRRDRVLDFMLEGVTL